MVPLSGKLVIEHLTLRPTFILILFQLGRTIEQGPHLDLSLVLFLIHLDAWCIDHAVTLAIPTASTHPLDID